MSTEGTQRYRVKYSRHYPLLAERWQFRYFDEEQQAHRFATQLREECEKDEECYACLKFVEVKDAKGKWARV